MKPEPGKNTGVIEVSPAPSDFKAGGETGIVEVLRVPSSNWRQYESPGEWQKDMTIGWDTEACMSFAANDSLETLGNWSVDQKQWSDDAVKFLTDNGYFNPDGTLNFSDRFTAKMSGTTTQGNTFPAVWQSIRTNGLVPETAWPFPVDTINIDPTDAWAIYYTEVPADIVALGKQFLQHFQIQYEWAIYPGSGASLESIENMLTVAPLHISTAVCPPWNTSDPIAGCGPGTQHGTMLSYANASGYGILDHYNPFDKTFKSDYTITYAMRGIIIPTEATPAPAPFHYVFTMDLAYGAAVSPELTALQTALQSLLNGSGKPYMKPGVFGPYGPQTKAAVAAFQAVHGISDDGTHFGPKTRAAMNAALAGN